MPTGPAPREDAAFDRATFAFGRAWARVWETDPTLWRHSAGHDHDASAPCVGDAAALGRVPATPSVVAGSSGRTVFPDVTAELVRRLMRVTQFTVRTDEDGLVTKRPEGAPGWAAVDARTRQLPGRRLAE